MGKKGVKLSIEHRLKLSIAHKGQVSPMLGRKHTEATKLKMSLAQRGRKVSPEGRENMRIAQLGKRTGALNHKWKGDNVGYLALHSWVERNLGKPSLCENCKTVSAKKYEWANVDHSYKRNLKDWIRLCTPCHREYDYNNHLSDIGSRGGSVPNKLTSTFR